MYEITCCVHRDVDNVTEEISELMKKDNGVTKMMLASIQGAIAARTLGQHPKVRHIEPAVIKEYFQAIEANRQFNSNQGIAMTMISQPPAQAQPSATLQSATSPQQRRQLSE